VNIPVKKLLIVKLLVRQPPGLPDMLRRPCTIHNALHHCNEYGAVIMAEPSRELHPVHLMNVEQYGTIKSGFRPSEQANAWSVL